MSLAQCLCAALGHANVVELALVSELLESTEDAFKGVIVVDTGAFEHVQALLPVEGGKDGVDAPSDILGGAVRHKRVSFSSALEGMHTS